MKNPLKSLVAVVALAGLSVAAYAQAPKILVVDMAKLYDNHYQTIEYNAKLQADDQKAREEVGRLEQELNKLAGDYEKFLKDNGIAAVGQDGRIEMDPKFTPPGFASEDKKKKMVEDLQNETIDRLRTLMTKREEGQKFVGQTQQTLKQRLQTFRTVMVEQISKTASEIAKRKGATMLIDKAGPTLIGIPAVLYVDSSIDITDEVMKELNKDRPAVSATATTTAAPAPSGQTAAPASTTAPATTTTDGAPKIQLPGSPVKK